MRSLLLFVAMSVAAVAQPVGQNPAWFPDTNGDGQVWAFNQAPSPFETLTIHSTGSFLGVGVVEITAERARELKLTEERGVLVSRVESADSPAAKAGLQVGDVLLEYNGQRIDGTEQFGRLVRETPAGRKVRLSVWRAAKPLTLEAVIEDRKMRMASPASPQIHSFEFPDGGDLMRNFPRPELAWRTGVLGIECQSIGDQLAEYFGVKHGVLVLSVAKDSPAGKAGLKAGDVITRVGEHPIATPGEIISAVHDHSSKDLKVTLMRDRKETSFNVNVDENNGRGHRTPEPRPVSLPQ
jgi:serine protease Do